MKDFKYLKEYIVNFYDEYLKFIVNAESDYIFNSSPYTDYMKRECKYIFLDKQIYHYFEDDTNLENIISENSVIVTNVGNYEDFTPEQLEYADFYKIDGGIYLLNTVYMHSSIYIKRSDVEYCKRQYKRLLDKEVI